MCESNVFLLRRGKEEEFLEDVSMIKVDGSLLHLTTILGEKKSIRGEIVYVDLEGHKVLVREIRERRK